VVRKAEEILKKFLDAGPKWFSVGVSSAARSFASFPSFGVWLTLPRRLVLHRYKS